MTPRVENNETHKLLEFLQWIRKCLDEPYSFLYRTIILAHIASHTPKKEKKIHLFRVREGAGGGSKTHSLAENFSFPLLSSELSPTFLFIFLVITLEPSMTKPLRLSIGTQTLGC